MKTLLILIMILIGRWDATGFADSIAGIYASVQHPEKEMIVIHENGWIEIYGDAKDLPDNRISLGYVSRASQYTINQGELVLDDGLSFSIDPQPSFNGNAYMKTDKSPFFPTAEQLAISGLVWQNDELGDLFFEDNGIVHCMGSEDGKYENGILELHGNVYLVQRSVWSDGFSDSFFLTDQTLTLYRLEDGESMGRLLLVHESEPFVLE